MGGVTLTDVAKRTAGFSGADLENLMNESAILTARRNKKAITLDEITTPRTASSQALRAER